MKLLYKTWVTPDMRTHTKVRKLTGSKDAIRKAFEEASDELWEASKAGTIIDYTLELKE